MEHVPENIENKYEEFLELLKTNPDAIEGQAVKNEVKELLELAFKRVDNDYHWRDIITGLLKLNIVDKDEIKEQYKEFLLDIAFKKAKSDFGWAHDVPLWLESNIINKNEIQEQCKELFNIVIEKAKSDSKWACVVPVWLNSNIIDKNEIKEQYMELLNISFRTAKYSRSYLKEIPNLLKLNTIDSEIKEKYKKMIEEIFEQTDFSYNLGEILQKLLEVNILDKSDKERYKKLLESIFKKEHSLNLENALEKLLEINILDESDKERCKQKCKQRSFIDEVNNMNNKLLELSIRDEDDKERYEGKIINIHGKNFLHYLFRIIEGNQDGVGIRILSNLIKLKIIDRDEIKEQYKELMMAILKNIRRDPKIYWIETLSKLLELKIIDKSEIKEEYKKILDKVVGQGEVNLKIKGVLTELLELSILDENDNERYIELLDKLVEQGKEDANIMIVLTKLLELNTIGRSAIKQRYINFLDLAFKKAESDSHRAEYVVPQLLKVNLKVNIVNKDEIKEPYKKILNMAFKESKSGKILYQLPTLLELDIIHVSEINTEMLKNITLTCLLFLEKNNEDINVDDLKFIDKIGECFTDDEIDYLYKLDYKDWGNIRNAVNNKDYQKIWEVKKRFYPYEEKYKQQKLEEYFGEGIWTYFIDKVPGNKKLKNRFRDPHTALLHADKIINLAKQLEIKGITKEKFLKNYLGIAGDRSNGYQQLNDFLEKYRFDWKELIEKELRDENGLKNNGEFIQYVNNLFEKENTGDLYKNLDELENVLTILNMINQKKALIELQKLSESKDPKDKKLYEYYKGAIFHPRTRPIIMEMYKNPKKFLGLDDTTVNDLKRIHQAKKPSNMVENFEYLDFDAKDLVDCLPLGIYDQLSYFKQFEMKFYISGSEVYTKEELQQGIRVLLDCNAEKMSKLCKSLRDKIKNIEWYQTWWENQDNFVQTVLQEYGTKGFIDLLGTFNFSGLEKYKNLKEMTAKISPKIDPNNWFNGFNCDSLAEGHGKKVVAMFNPYCTDFCIYEGDQDPKKDNLKVTSWVTLNRAIPENFKTLLDKVKNETTYDIATVLGDEFEDYKDPNEYVITMDNIEANPNFGRKNEEAVRKMYEKFFSEYVRQNPISPNGIPINTSKFYSGVNYNKLNILTNKVPNKSLPVFVNAYSDNCESYSLQGNLDAGVQKEKEKKTGIHPLSIEDVVQISYMEGKIYPSSIKDHLGNLQHEITASILNNTLKGRPNLSFVWYNEEGKIGGYILAYQGKMENGKPGIYISDFVVEEKYRGAGRNMIYYWIDVLKKNKKEFADIPIFTRAREKTSYPLIQLFAKKQLCDITEDEEVEDGGEKFHRVVMNPKI